MEEQSMKYLVRAIADATRAAAKELFSKYPGHYYYFALISTGEALPPYISAWSEEALAEAGDAETLRWSYADSPFCAYGWDEHFGRVRTLFSERPAMDFSDVEAWGAEYKLRFDAMEQALRQLDNEGLFGQGKDRLRIVINAEVMPPDSSNTLRAQRLNPPEALTRWLEEAAEPEA
jgi:hypothetical protein